jgi:hypothetical protein
MRRRREKSETIEVDFGRKEVFFVWESMKKRQGCSNSSYD